MATEAVALPLENLVPCRETDIFIAERVMGWRYDGGGWRYPNGEPTLLPAFSSRMAHAWEIVEHFTGQMGFAGGLLSFQGPLFKADAERLLGASPLGETCWYCTVRAPRGRSMTLCADTAPLAICRAALWLVEAVAEEASR